MLEQTETTLSLSLRLRIWILQETGGSANATESTYPGVQCADISLCLRLSLVYTLFTVARTIPQNSILALSHDGRCRHNADQCRVSCKPPASCACKLIQRNQRGPSTHEEAECLRACQPKNVQQLQWHLLPNQNYLAHVARTSQHSLFFYFFSMSLAWGLEVRRFRVVERLVPSGVWITLYEIPPCSNLSLCSHFRGPNPLRSITLRELLRRPPDLSRALSGTHWILTDTSALA